MLHVIEGPAGSGKTTKAYEILLKGAGEHKDRNYILVIPEQSSISAQKDIVEMSPNKGLLNIDILSFNRLAHRIFEAAGGAACDLIDDSGKNLIIRRIADDIIDQLSVIGGDLKKRGYVAEIRSVISEFMQYGIGWDDLSLIAEKTEKRSPYLAKKLKDVEIIYRRFTEYMGSDFMTREELLIKAASMAGKVSFLKEATLIFDSFTGFTPVQYTFIEALLSKSRDIYVCITREGGLRGGLFSLGDGTKDRLEAIAEHMGGLDEIVLEGDRRHKKTSDIAVLGARIFELKSADKPEGDGSVSFLQTTEPYSEVREALQQISALVRRRGYHYRECGILMGDTALYADIVRSEAAGLGIPVYVDQTRHIALNPFTELIRTVFLILNEDFSYSSVFHLLRSYLLDIPTDDIDLAENYCLATGVRGLRAWEKPFELIFRGVSEDMRLAAERVRLKLIKTLEPVLSLSGSGRSSENRSARSERPPVRLSENQFAQSARPHFAGEIDMDLGHVARYAPQIQSIPPQTGDAHLGQSVFGQSAVSGETDVNAEHIAFGDHFRISDIITAVRDICASLEVEKKLEEYREYFENNSDPERAMEYSQIYDILNGQFNNMESLIGDQEVSFKEFSELYEDALSEIRVGVIPPMSDVVMAGDLTRSRFSHIRALFFIGMTEGVIPSAGNKGGLISDSDRRLLNEAGVEIAPTAAENAEKEKFYFYLNLMKPAEKVSFSYPALSLDGAAQRESYFMKEARRTLIVKEAARGGNKREIFSKDSLIASFAESVELSPDKAAVCLKALEAVESSPGTGSMIEALLKQSETEEILEKEAGDMLFGKSLIESPTELERFASCPYSHFLGYGLRLLERRVYGFELRDMGTLLHRVLELYSRKLSMEKSGFSSVGDALSDAILESALKDVLLDESYLRTASLISSGARYAHAFERLKKYAKRSIDTLRFQSRKGSFNNVYFEKKFVSADLKGTIDRSDEAVTDSGIFIDVIDYKTGNKTFDPDRIYNGLDIQLPVYMNAALEMRRSVIKDREVRPAGLFYYHVDDPLVEGMRGSEQAVIDEEIRKKLKLRGVVNEDMEAVRAFDRDIEETGRSIVIPAGFKKDGTPLSSAALYPEKALMGMVYHTIALTEELKNKIVSGEVSRSPYSLDGRSGCDYCAYKEICDGGRKRKLIKHAFPGDWIT